jgi:hypothetical protein
MQRFSMKIITPIRLAIIMILLFPLSNSSLPAKHGENDYNLYEASHRNFSSPQTNTEFPNI